MVYFLIASVCAVEVIPLTFGVFLLTLENAPYGAGWQLCSNALLRCISDTVTHRVMGCFVTNHYTGKATFPFLSSIAESGF